MEVIAMRGVIVGTEHRVEEAAGALASLAQERRIATLLRPGGKNPKAATVDHEPRDIQRIGGCMMTHARVRPPVDAAAGIASEMLYPADGDAEMANSDRLEHVPFPQGERKRRAA